MMMTPREYRTWAFYAVVAVAIVAGSSASAAVVLSNGTPDTGYANFYAWFDASDGVLGSGTPWDGSSVDWWHDRTENGRDIYRVNVQVERWPTFLNGIAPNNQPAVRFDGNDYLWGNHTDEFGTIDTSANGRTYFVVTSVRNLNSYVFDSSSSTGRNSLISGQVANPNAWWIYSGVSIIESAAVDLDGWAIHTITFDTSTDNMSHYINGALVTSETAELTSMAGLMLGARYSLASYLDGDIAELMIYDELLSSSDQQDIEAYLINKYFNGSIPPTLLITEDPVELPLAPGSTVLPVAVVSDPETPTGSLTVWVSAGSSANLTVSVDSVNASTGEVQLQIQQSASLTEGVYPIELSVSDGTHTTSKTLDVIPLGPVLAGGAPSVTYPHFYAWFDAANGVNGSGAPADGTAVTSWEDQTGNGHDLLNVDGDTTHRPTYATGVANGLNAVRFNGDDYITGTSNQFGTIETVGRTFAIMMRVHTYNRDYVFDSVNKDGRNALLAGQSANLYVWWPYTGEGNGVQAGPVDFTWQCHVITLDGVSGQIEHYVDGELVGSGNATLHDMIGMTLGARYSLDSGLDGDIAEFLIYDSVLNETDRQSIESYLADKYPPVSILSGGVPNLAFSGLYAWFDASDGVNGPGAPADGTPVTSWEDSSGQGRLLNKISAETVELPTYRSGVANGYPAVEFDGDAYIWGGSTPEGFGSLSGKLTVFWVTELRSIHQYIFDGVKGAGRHAMISGQADSPGLWNLFTGYSPASVGPPVATGVVQVHSAVFTDGYNEHFINGVSVASGSSQMAPLTGLVLGGRYDLTQRLDGDLAEMLIYSGALSASDRQAVESYLLSKHPITTPPWSPLEFVDVYTSGEEGYPVYRIPAIIRTTSGALLAFCEARQDGDHSENDIVVKRSTDDGYTWSPLMLLDDAGTDSLNDPLAVQVKTGPNAGRIYLHYMRFPVRCHVDCVTTGYGATSSHNYLVYSDDDGLTWQGPIDVTTQFRPVTSSYAGSPGIGIQKRHAPQAGRIVMPLRMRTGPGTDMLAYTTYSDDGGATWTYGSPVDITSVDGVADEPQIVELDNGTLMMNSRQTGAATTNRKLAFSTDGGATWSALSDDDELLVTAVMASILRYTDPLDGALSRILFSSPSEAGRSNGSIRLSYDGGDTWPIEKLLYPGGYGYSCLTTLDDGGIGALFERDGTDYISLAHLSLAWLTDGADVPPCPGDLDGDDDIDATDAGIFITCLAGDGVMTPPAGCTTAQFNAADLDNDGDVDLQDCAEFQSLLGQSCP